MATKQEQEPSNRYVQNSKVKSPSNTKVSTASYVVTKNKNKFFRPVGGNLQGFNYIKTTPR